MRLSQAAKSIDLSTITLLFAFMVISAQLRLGGFYTRTAEAVTSLKSSPSLLLAAVILLTGVLSAVFMNDIVCLALPPVIIQTCRHRRLDPVPYLLAIACAANVGSAATLIGNPQNILIGQALRLSFSGYLIMAGIPSLLGLVIMWAVIAWQYRSRWHTGVDSLKERAENLQPWNGWNLRADRRNALGIFLFTGLPRDISALAAAGRSSSRKLHSRTMLGLVDWRSWCSSAGFHRQPRPRPDQVLTRGGSCSVTGSIWRTRDGSSITVLHSNTVSKCPPSCSLCPLQPSSRGPVLALVTFDNLLIVGGMNVIVVESAAAHGIRIDWRNHAPRASLSPC